ncbi:SCO3242 family prenyltransferase [Streptomyces liangshanensis]|uniref:SCO3242 family prenyltransferase n=1 Tax=Streptomyces liangshanensis TaxID=2717324 RepID=UPI0036DCA31A
MTTATRARTVPGPESRADAVAAPSPSPSPASRFRTLVELVRAPAAITVPGDVLAGALASGRAPVARTLALAASSVALYWAGMALNDWADRDEDAVERPERPIPSGRLTPGAALAVAVGLTGAGVGIAALAGGGRTVLRRTLPLAAAVWAYDLGLKSTPLGPATMAAARALDVLHGAPPGRTAPALPAAATIAAHTLAVTRLSRHEVHGAPHSEPRVSLATTAMITATLATPATRLLTSLVRASAAASAIPFLPTTARHAAEPTSAAAPPTTTARHAAPAPIPHPIAVRGPGPAVSAVPSPTQARHRTPAPEPGRPPTTKPHPGQASVARPPAASARQVAPAGHRAPPAGGQPEPAPLTQPHQVPPAAVLLAAVGGRPEPEPVAAPLTATVRGAGPAAQPPAAVGRRTGPAPVATSASPTPSAPAAPSGGPVRFTAAQWLAVAGAGAQLAGPAAVSVARLLATRTDARATPGAATPRTATASATAGARTATALAPGDAGARAIATALVTATVAATYAVTCVRAQSAVARHPSAPRVRAAVGAGIHALLPLQAALVARAGAPLAALPLGLALPVLGRLARKVSST